MEKSSLLHYGRCSTSMHPKQLLIFLNPPLKTNPLEHLCSKCADRVFNGITPANPIPPGWHIVIMETRTKHCLYQAMYQLKYAGDRYRL
ncbi:MAG: hypothetical protein WBM02_10425 [bacterium]